MLPEILASSYIRYKEDTNVFTTWLSKAAVACGYKPAQREQHKQRPAQQQTPTTTPRLKGKARKEAKAAAAESKKLSDDFEAPQPTVKYNITTQELLNQAEAVAKSGKAAVKVPDSVVRIVQRAIGARKRCASWFQKTGILSEEDSTKTHLHFVATLERALSTLRPDLQPSEIVSPKKGSNPTTAASAEELKNRFSVLGLEETGDDLDLAATEAATDLSVAKKSPTKNCIVEIYELEDQSDIEHAFIIFCFFEDLHRVQKCIQETWKDYRTSKCDLTVASVTTNLAFNLVRRAEDELIANLDPKRYSKPDSYRALSMTIFYEDSFARGEDPEEKLASNESLRLTPFDDFIYLPTARTLLNFRRMMRLEIDYPQPMPPFRFNYISRPELLELPETKKAEQEHLLLSQILMDSSLNDLIKPGLKEERGRESPPEDEFSDGLLKLRKEGEVSAWIVFASRVILDINDILGEDVKRGYRELCQAGAAATKTLDFQPEGNELVPGGGLCWHVKDVGIAQNVHDVAEFWIKEAPLPSVKAIFAANEKPENESLDFHELPQEIKDRLRAQGVHNDDVLPEHEANAKRMNLSPIKPAEDPAFIFNCNPLYCGSLAFNIAIDMEIAGIKLANHHLTIFAVAHLYNALQQTEVVQGKWPELDKIIELHIGQLFAGKLPTKPSECHTRLSVRMGASASDFARNRRTTTRGQGLTGKGMKHLPKFAISASTQMLSDYSCHKEAPAKSLARIEGAIQEHTKVNSGQTKKATKRQLTPLQFLMHVRAWLPQVMQDTKVDYIRMVRTCHRLLNRVKKRIHQRLGYLYPKVDDGYSNDHGLLFMVACILYQAAETNYAKEQVFKARERGDLPEDPHLEVAGEVMQEFLDKHGASDGVAPLTEGGPAHWNDI